MVRESLMKLNITDGEVTILLVGDRKIRRLNREFLGRDRPTNVIAFPYGREGGLEGDIALSVDTVLREVKGDYLTEEEKLFFYALHGLLHLAGYDHEGEENSAGKMREVQKKLFTEVTGKEVV